MFPHFDFEVIRYSLGYLFVEGMTFTLTLTALVAAAGLAIGTLLAVVRLSRIPVLSHVVIGYVNLIRSLPLVLVIFWFYFLIPYLIGWVSGAGRPVPVGAYQSVLVTFTLFEAAYFSEIMRSGIQSVSIGQTRAAAALGLRPWQAMVYVVLPQAVRNMLPVLLTQTVILFQDTSLVYVVALTDFFGAASKVAKRDGRLVEMYLFAAAVYFVMSFGLSTLVRSLQLRRRPAT